MRHRASQGCAEAPCEDRCFENNSELLAEDLELCALWPLADDHELVHPSGCEQLAVGLEQQVESLLSREAANGEHKRAICRQLNGRLLTGKPVDPLRVHRVQHHFDCSRTDAVAVGVSATSAETAVERTSWGCTRRDAASNTVRRTRLNWGSIQLSDT